MDPLTGWPDEVLPELTRIVSTIANNKNVSKFYIGRGVDLSERKSKHSCDEIIAIYSTDSIDNAIEVEEYLIKTFYSHPKCDNEAPHGGGGVSEEYGSYVYAAIWF
jgi:hypothetical protein